MSDCRRLDRRSLVLLSLSGFVTSCAGAAHAPGAAVSPGVRQDLDTFLDDAASSFGTVGHSVAVLRRGELVYERHAGLADREAGIPVSAGSVYPIFSISKLFMLVALFQAAQRGEIDLDAPISSIRGDLPAAWRAITLRQAITHVSGLPDYLKDPYQLPGSADEAFESIRAEPLHFPPGTRSEYNQTNALLAREALERAAGRSLAELVGRQFRRAGMTHARYREGGATVENLVASYRPQPDRSEPPARYEIAAWPAYAFGSSGIVTTLGDMVRWSRSLLAGDFLPTPVLRDIWRPYRLSSGATAWHANGWEYESHGDVTIVGHEGGGRVVWRHFFRTANPADSATVIYLDNGGRTHLARHRLASLMAERVMPGAARATAVFEEHLLRRLARNQWDESADWLGREAASLSDGALEDAVNRVGYDAMFALGAHAALAPFRWNVQRFPNSSNAHDSLGEAYRATGDLMAARRSYARALELDPGNARILATLNDIDAAITAGR